mmetsp:Transcript_87867/g.273087  ORF Transcript_87867/g.273087 Transcript_87867/m.273087 type:complete len:311 (-) Transcript_87867:3-935(-)
MFCCSALCTLTIRIADELTPRMGPWATTSLARCGGRPLSAISARWSTALARQKAPMASLAPGAPMPAALPPKFPSAATGEMEATGETPKVINGSRYGCCPAAGKACDWDCICAWISICSSGGGAEVCTGASEVAAAAGGGLAAAGPAAPVAEEAAQGTAVLPAESYGMDLAAASASQYSAAALAQYYAALVGAPQYLAGTQLQHLDPLQQAALAQYSLYAAALAAQTSDPGAGGSAALLGGSGGPSTAWITNRLIEREKARLDRNFDEADKIRAELRQRGVEVDDRLRTWSARDGRRGHRPNHNDVPEPE